MEVQKKMTKAFKKKANTTWMSKLFPVSKVRKLVCTRVPSGVTKKIPKSLDAGQKSFDLGQPVRINRTNQGNSLIILKGWVMVTNLV